MKDQNDDWHEIIGKDDHEISVVHFTQGNSNAKKFSGINYVGGYSTPCTSGSVNLQAESIAFYVKNSHVGGIRVKLMTEIRYYNYNLWKYVVTEKEMLHDEAYLVSGAGSIEVLPDGKIDTEGIQYVFEEGSTVTFSVDVDYSGVTQGGSVSDEGWQVRLFKPSGSLAQSWTVADNQRDHRIYYTVPDGAYDSEGRNDWEVTLRNILFDQDEKDVFIIDTYEKMPGVTTVKLDKSDYDKNDLITVTVEAKANPSGTNDIYEFYCLAYYGNQRNDYTLAPTYKRATGIGDSNYQTSFTLTAYKGDKWLTVECTAYDAKHDSGGRAGTTGYSQVYIKDIDPVPPTPPPRPPSDIDWMKIIIAVIVFVIFLAVGLFAPFPKKFGMYGSIICIVIGIALAILIYLGLIG